MRARVDDHHFLAPTRTRTKERHHGRRHPRQDHHLVRTRSHEVRAGADPKEFLFFNRDAAGKKAGREFIQRLKERTIGRDKSVKISAFQTQLKAIKRYGRSAASDLSVITSPTLIANGDNDRMVPSVLSEDLHRRIKGSELVIYPNSGHGGIFQYWKRFVPVAVRFLSADSRV